MSQSEPPAALMNLQGQSRVSETSMPLQFRDDITHVTAMSPLCPRRGRRVVPRAGHAPTPNRESPIRCQAGNGNVLGFPSRFCKFNLMGENNKTLWVESSRHPQAETSLVRAPGVFRGKRRVQRYSSTAHCHRGWQGPAGGVLPARSCFYPAMLRCNTRG